MLAVPSDVTIVGTVLALVVAILVLSGLALYVAFRVRETLREEKGGSAKAAKVAFLIGLLFLSGGVFYFFASGFSPSGGGTTSLGTTSTTTSSSHSTSGVSTTSSTSSSSTSSSTSSTSSKTSTTSTSSAGQVSISVQCPTSGTSVTAGSTFACSVTIYNLGSTTYQSATLLSSGDFSQFTFLSCSETVNGASATCTVVSSSQVAGGSISPGTTVITISVQASTTAGQKNCTLTLAAPGMPQPISQSFVIQVTNKP